MEYLTFINSPSHGDVILINKNNCYCFMGNYFMNRSFLLETGSKTHNDWKVIVSVLIPIINRALNTEGSSLKKKNFN